MNVPHSSSSLLTGGISSVPLDDDGTSRTAASREYHVGDLDSTLVACVSDFYDRARAVGIGEVGASTDDGRPDFTDDNGSSRNRNGVGDHVSASVEEENLAAPVGVDEVLDRGGIIRNTVTDGSGSADAGELAGSVTRVVRTATAIDATR